MSLIEDELANVFHGRVKRKANKTRKLRATAKRVASGSSEVMVKITGFGKGAAHVKSHLEYITRNAKIEMENDRGEVFRDKEEIKGLFNDWKNEIGDHKRHKNQRDTMHMVLSMPEHVEPEAVKNATREFAKTAFGKNHEYVFVLHTDQPHPHCHLTVKCRGFNGKMLHVSPDDREQWRELFAEKMRDQGVDAEATPRFSRGIVQRPERNVVRHIERGDRSHAPRVPKVKAAKIAEAAKELIAELHGTPTPAKPWDDAIAIRQRKVRQAWLNAADALEKTNTRKTFNGKELINERPDYTSLDTARVRAAQRAAARAAAIPQSNPATFGPGAPPQSVAGMRNVSGIAMVQHSGGIEKLLPTDAYDFLAKQSRADPEMRRPRTGNFGALGDAGGQEGYLTTSAENKALASRIRAFVGAMPVPMTEQDRLKADLMQKFGKEPAKLRTVVEKAQAAPVQAPDLGKTISPQRQQDIER